MPILGVNRYRLSRCTCLAGGFDSQNSRVFLYRAQPGLVTRFTRNR